MPKAADMTPAPTDFVYMDIAAKDQERLRFVGTVIDRGDGYSGRYRNAWVRISAGDTTIHVTATPNSELGSAPVGAQVDLACTLTGLVDLAAGVYFGRRAQLLSIVHP